MIDQEVILQKTHYGLFIFSQLLGSYCADSFFSLGLVGNDCKITKNPFNQNRLTLLISKRDGVFCYRDTEMENFQGDAFDFAALHYHLSGGELFERINLDWNLHIGEPKVFYSIDKTKTLPVTLEAMPRFSIYRYPITNTTPMALINPLHVYKVVKGTRYKQQTEELREIKNTKAASQFKQSNFDYVTASGEFTKRGEKGLVRHSGLLTLDFDHVDNLPLLKKTLHSDPKIETTLIFVSPSVNGLKWIVPIDIQQISHELWFTAVSTYLKREYDLKVDPSGKDIARACFLPYDPEVYIHPKYLMQIPRI